MFGHLTQDTDVLLSHLPLGLRDAIAMGAIGVVGPAALEHLAAGGGV